ncbi:MAG: hypothetical protein L7H10_01565 [Vulcanisaeta sp.]|nr:hypothetical protein [Vulcanisaeta sp.]
MGTSLVVDELIKKLIKLVGDGWINLEDLENALGIKIDLDVVNKLSRTGLFEVMYSTLDNTFYIRRRVAGNTITTKKGSKGRDSDVVSNGGGKVNLQAIVDEIRRRFRGMIPKPEFEDWLASNVPGNWHLVYNQLLNDGVIEEVVISGMMFVRVTE